MTLDSQKPLLPFYPGDINGYSDNHVDTYSWDEEAGLLASESAV